MEEVEVDGAAVDEMKADEEELQRPLAAEQHRPDLCRSRSQAGRPQSSHRRQNIKKRLAANLSARTRRHRRGANWIERLDEVVHFTLH